MPALLPTDIMRGLNQVNVMDPIQAAQARAILEETQLKNQGIPAQNQQTELQNTGIRQQNDRYGESTPDILKQLGLKTQTDTADLPTHQYEGMVANTKMDALKQFLSGSNPHVQTSPSAGQQSSPATAPQGIKGLIDGLPNMSLPDLMDLKKKNQQMGGALSQFIDPEFNARMQTEKKVMYDDLASPEWAAKIQGLGTKNTNASTAFNEFRKMHPMIDLLPESEQKSIQQESFKANAQPNMAMMMGAPIPSTAMDSAAKRVANRESTLSEEMAKGFARRPDAFQIHDELVNKVKALDPEFGEQDTESGAAFARNAATRRYVAAIDNARTTAARIADLTKQNAGTPSPALNALINKFKVQAGDVDAAKVAIGQIAGTEEYSGAFTRNGGGSETTRGWADELGKLIYQQGPQAAASSNELLRAFDRNRQALMKQGGGYIKKPSYQFITDSGYQSKQPAAGATGPLSKDEAHWYLDQAKGDVAAAKAAAAKDGRTF